MENRVAVGANTLPSITNMGLFIVDEPWLHYDRNIEINVLIFVVDGCVNVCEEDIDFHVKEGEAFFLKNNRRHWGKTLTPAGSKWFWICFNPFVIEGGESMYWLPKQIALSNPKQIKHKLSMMLELHQSHHHYRNQVNNSNLYQVFIEILSQQSMVKSKSHTSMIADDIIKLLHENVERCFSADIISDALNMNYNYLCRIFKQEIGTTINRYYTELKIQKAIELLRSSDLNIAQISDRLSFPNPYYFSRVFKKVTGFAPSNHQNHMYR